MSGPAYAELSARRPKARTLAVPVLLVWVFLLPLALLLAPLVFAGCLLWGADPFRGAAACWQFFDGLRGLRVTVEAPGSPISIRFY